MKAVLDTHALIWIAEADSRLSQTVLDFVAGCTEGDLCFSDISLLEIAMLYQKQRIPNRTPLKELLQKTEIHFRMLPIKSGIAAGAYALALPHSDPFDRVIVATAKYHQIPLITRDRLIIESNCVNTLW